MFTTLLNSIGPAITLVNTVIEITEKITAQVHAHKRAKKMHTVLTIADIAGIIIDKVLPMAERVCASIFGGWKAWNTKTP